MKTSTNSEIEYGADWFVVAKSKQRMTAIDQLFDVITSPQYAIAPRRNTTLFTVKKHFACSTLLPASTDPFRNSSKKNDYSVQNDKRPP